MKCIPNLLCAIVTLSLSQVLLSADASDNFSAYLKNSDSLTSRTVDGESRQLILAAGESVESNVSLGDSVLTIEYQPAADTKAGIYLQGRYELALVDADQDPDLTFADAGGVQRRVPDVAGVAPLTDVEQVPGQWQTLSVKFRAPRYDMHVMLGHACRKPSVEPRTRSATRHVSHGHELLSAGRMNTDGRIEVHLG
jgi:hypothetical protein